MQDQSLTESSQSDLHTTMGQYAPNTISSDENSEGSAEQNWLTHSAATDSESEGALVELPSTQGYRNSPAKKLPSTEDPEYDGPVTALPS